MPPLEADKPKLLLLSVKPQPALDALLAKIVVWLIANGLEAHTPIRGPIEFRKKEDA